MENNEVVTRVKKSKKYSSLMESTLNNVYISKPYNEEGLKSKLHQIWGAYYTSRPDFKKLLKKIQTNELNIESMLKIHSSSKEREEEATQIFNYIFSIVGNNRSILDIGCGFNPIYLINRDEFKTYLCVDIDHKQQEFFVELFRMSGKVGMQARTGDALIDSFDYADVVFAFKLLPVLDQINKVQCNAFLSNLKCNSLVVTFPNRSLGGKNKGMIDNYRDEYVNRIEGLGYKLESEKVFKNESVYIFVKQNRAD